MKKQSIANTVEPKKILIYQGHNSGLDEYGKSHYCNVWRCSECGNDNYYDEFSGELI